MTEESDSAAVADPASRYLRREGVSGVGMQDEALRNLQNDLETLRAYIALKDIQHCEQSPECFLSVVSHLIYSHFKRLEKPDISRPIDTAPLKGLRLDLSFQSPSVEETKELCKSAMRFLEDRFYIPFYRVEADELHEIKWPISSAGVVFYNDNLDFFIHVTYAENEGIPILIIANKDVAGEEQAKVAAAMKRIQAHCDHLGYCLNMTKCEVFSYNVRCLQESVISAAGEAAQADDGKPVLPLLMHLANVFMTIDITGSTAAEQVAVYAQLHQFCLMFSAEMSLVLRALYRLCIVGLLYPEAMQYVYNYLSLVAVRQIESYTLANDGNDNIADAIMCRILVFHCFWKTQEQLKVPGTTSDSRKQQASLGSIVARMEDPAYIPFSKHVWLTYPERQSFDVFSFSVEVAPFRKHVKNPDDDDYPKPSTIETPRSWDAARREEKPNFMVVLLLQDAQQYVTNFQFAKPMCSAYFIPVRPRVYDVYILEELIQAIGRQPLFQWATKVAKQTANVRQIVDPVGVGTTSLQRVHAWYSKSTEVNGNWESEYLEALPPAQTITAQFDRVIGPALGRRQRIEQLRKHIPYWVQKNIRSMSTALQKAKSLPTPSTPGYPLAIDDQELRNLPKGLYDDTTDTFVNVANLANPERRVDLESLRKPVQYDKTEPLRAIGNFDVCTATFTYKDEFVIRAEKLLHSSVLIRSETFTIGLEDFKTTRITNVTAPSRDAFHFNSYTTLDAIFQLANQAGLPMVIEISAPIYAATEDATMHSSVIMYDPSQEEDNRVVIVDSVPWNDINKDEYGIKENQIPGIFFSTGDVPREGRKRASFLYPGATSTTISPYSVVNFPHQLMEIYRAEDKAKGRTTHGGTCSFLFIDMLYAFYLYLMKHWDPYRKRTIPLVDVVTASPEMYSEPLDIIEFQRNAVNTFVAPVTKTAYTMRNKL